MKYYLSKHALTDGIIQVNGKRSTIRPTMISVNSRGFLQHHHKPYWHETLEEAIEHANHLREMKIIHLKRQISKISKLKFE